MSVVLSLWWGELHAPERRPPMREIVGDVALSERVTLREMLSPTQHRSIAWPRQHAMSECRDAGYSYAAIGRFFGRDHTTVIHGVRRHNDRASNPPAPTRSPRMNTSAARPSASLIGSP